MNRTFEIKTVDEYNTIAGQKTLHPLVSMIDFSRIRPGARKRDVEVQALSFGFYIVFLKDDKHCTIRYGRNNYDYQKGTLV